MRNRGKTDVQEVYEKLGKVLQLAKHGKEVREECRRCVGCRGQECRA
jgi:hypothetical protein